MFKQVFSVLCAITFCASLAQSQWLSKVDEHLPSFSTSSREHDAGPVAAAEYYMNKRKFGLGYIPQDAVRTARGHMTAMRANSKNGSALSSNGVSQNVALAASTAQWSLVGPTNIGGRIECLAVHPTDPKTAYAGAADGGVWKTTDGGESWNPLTDNMETLAMGSLAIDPQNPNVVYAGTGELPNGDTYTGYGLYRSADSGASWMNIGPTRVAAYTAVIVNPKHSNIIYASAGRAGGGVLRTTDTGNSWEWLAGGLPQGQVTDLALSMNGDEAVLYAGVASHGVYRSTNGGNTWTNQTPNWESMRRICLTTDPKNWQHVAALSVNDVVTEGEDDLEGIQRSDDGGDNWTPIDETFQIGGQTLFAIPGAAAPQGTYDAYLKADPSNFDHMLVGGISIWELQPGSSDWTDVAHSYNGGIHPDQHAAAFAPSDPSIVYFGQDGGLFTSEDGGSTINQSTSLPIAITQFYGIGIDQTVPDVTYGGTQDNGTMYSKTAETWSTQAGGDGSYTLVDPTDHTTVYFAYTERPPAVIRNHAAGNIANIADSMSWLNPFAADASNGTIYWGAQHLWGSTDKGRSWTKQSNRSFGTSRSFISTIDAFGDGNTLALGTGTGKVYYSDDQAFTVNDVSTGLPGRFVSAIRFNPSSAATFYVALSGFGSGHVFKTTDAGEHWQNISSNLPDIPVNTLVIDPQNSSVMYIGTDVGVFVTPNDGGIWMPYGTGLPNVAIDELAIHKDSRVLRAGTHGRSMWQVPLINNVPAIAQPAQRTIWTIGDSARIEWYGFASSVSVDISSDGGASWHNIANNISGNSLVIDTVRYAPTANVLVKVWDNTQTTLISPRFEIAQRKAGTEAQVVGELPYYLYDIAFDQDDNVLWATHFYSSALYKIDPDRGTVLDSVPVTFTRTGNITGIGYDPKSQHLFVHQIVPTGTETWISYVYEVTKSGSIVRSVRSAAKYGTGITIRGDTIFAADRLMDRSTQTFSIARALTSDLKFNPALLMDPTVTALYGPRGLDYDTALHVFLLGFTDFQGTSSTDARLNGSFLYLLDPTDASTVKIYPITEGSSELTNIRGLAYDPRGAGNTAWITTLSTGGAKLVKVTLSDGPSGGAVVDPPRRVASSVEEQNALDDIFPNPANSIVTLPYTLDRSGEIVLRVLDAMGREVFAEQRYSNAGEQQQRLNLAQLSTGVYRVELFCNGERIGTRNLTLLR